MGVYSTKNQGYAERQRMQNASDDGNYWGRNFGSWDGAYGSTGRLQNQGNPFEAIMNRERISRKLQPTRKRATDWFGKGVIDPHFTDPVYAEEGYSPNANRGVMNYSNNERQVRAPSEPSQPSQRTSIDPKFVGMMNRLGYDKNQYFTEGGYTVEGERLRDWAERSKYDHGVMEGLVRRELGYGNTALNNELIKAGQNGVDISGVMGSRENYGLLKQLANENDKTFWTAKDGVGNAVQKFNKGVMGENSVKMADELVKSGIDPNFAYSKIGQRTIGNALNDLRNNPDTDENGNPISKIGENFDYNNPQKSLVNQKLQENQGVLGSLYPKQQDKIGKKASVGLLSLVDPKSIDEDNNITRRGMRIQGLTEQGIPIDKAVEIVNSIEDDEFKKSPTGRAVSVFGASDLNDLERIMKDNNIKKSVQDLEKGADEITKRVESTRMDDASNTSLVRNERENISGIYKNLGFRDYKERALKAIPYTSTELLENKEKDIQKEKSIKRIDKMSQKALRATGVLGNNGPWNLHPYGGLPEEYKINK